MIFSLTGALVLFAAIPAAHGQWSYLADEEELKGSVIADVGEVSHESLGKMTYDPLLEMETYRTLEYLEYVGSIRFCLDSQSIPSLSSSEAALTLVNDEEMVSIAVLKSSVGSIDVTVEPVYEIPCPQNGLLLRLDKNNFASIIGTFEGQTCVTVGRVV